jgi:hypothetical protein
LEDDIEWSGDVIISDESRFGLFDDSRRLWIQRGIYTERTFKPTPKHNTSFMVWGAIGKGFKSKLVFIEGNLNAVEYRRMLTQNGILDDMKDHFGDGVGHFQQDGAPAHRAKATVKFLEDSIDLIPDWPPNSPDLSVIENVWGILKAKIAKKEPKTIADLRSLLQQEWDNLDQRIIDHLIESMPRRFQMCLDEKGKSIGHLVRKLNLSERGGDSLVPPGILPIRDLGPTHIGQVVHIAIRAQSNHPSNLHTSSFWVILEVRKTLTPGPRLRTDLVAR